MSELDLGASIEAARAASEKAAAAYVEAQEVLEEKASALTAAQNKLRRLQRALAILNGEEEPAATPEPAAQAVAPAAPPAPPPTPKPQPTGPYAHVACGGCQERGTLAETFKPTKNGTMARLLVCGECGNEVYLG